MQLRRTFMQAPTRPRLFPALISLILALAIALSLALTTVRAVPTHPTAATRMSINCAQSALCTEVQEPEEVFGEDNYVGHDEPSALFYSKRPGSGNQMVYTL